VLPGAHEDLADYRTPEPLLGEALALARELPAGEEADRLVVAALEGLGDLRRMQGRYPDAERLLREPLRLAEDRLGRRDVQVAWLLIALAVTFKYWGRFDEASELYRRALEIAETAHGSEHPAVATLLHNLGGLAHARGDYRAAEAPARRAVGGDTARAEAVYRRALAIKDRLLGSRHPDLAVTLSNLGALLVSEHRFDEAEALLRRALDIFEWALEPTHPSLALCRENHADARQRSRAPSRRNPERKPR
jgi:tetratricopeptide (TPR) repeat protein